MRPSLLETVRRLREVFKPGTMRHWKDGDVMKMRDGSWEPVDDNDKPLTKPATAEPKKVDKKATSDDLPDDPWRYFKKVDGAELIPLDKLKTIRARPTGIKNAAVHMANAYNGDGEKRKPISVTKNSDGTYTVNDGNSTTNIAMNVKWKSLPAIVGECHLRRDTTMLMEAVFGEDVFKPGTIRKWATGTVIKTKEGDWIPYQGATKGIPKTPTKEMPHKEPEKPDAKTPDQKKPEVQAAPEHEPIEDVKSELDKLREKGVLPKDVSADEQIKKAETFLDSHKKNLPEAMKRLHDVVEGEGTAIMGRVKDVDSALGKLVRKPKYGTAESLKDGTGMRVVCKSIDDVLKNVENLKKAYKTSQADEEDYINHPKDGYRSYHLIIQDEDGLFKEVQIRTPNQDTWANWCHDVYKPHDDKQAKAIEKDKDEILGYGNGMSEYYYAKDKGSQQLPKPPPCPEVVEKTFGCMPT